jgi:hypothetical protein
MISVMAKKKIIRMDRDLPSLRCRCVCVCVSRARARGNNYHYRLSAEAEMEDASRCLSSYRVSPTDAYHFKSRLTVKLICEKPRTMPVVLNVSGLDST